MKYLIFLGFFLLVQLAAIASGVKPSIIKPIAPVYEACTEPVRSDFTAGDNSEEENDYKRAQQGYENCNKHNADLKKDYDSALADYDKKVRALSQAEQWQLHNEQRTYEINSSVDQAMGAYGVAKAGAEDAQIKQTSYRKKRQEATAAAAAFAAAAAAATFGGAGLWAASAAATARAVDAGIKERTWSDNKSEAIKATNSACELATKLSTSGAHCLAITPATPGFAQMADDITLTEGFANCSGSACDKSTGLSPAGANLNKTPGGLSSFAAGNPLLKVNPDGSITTKDGKKLSPNSFANEAALVALGLSPADAKKAMAEIKKDEAKAGKEVPHDALASEKKTTGMPLGFVGSEAGSGAAKTTEIIVNGDAAREKELLGSTSGEKREVASVEGLAKDFNGEQIGVAGDDIFKMMNRRYKFKTSHDDFIAP